MNTIRIVSTLTALSMVLATPAFAAEFTKGQVTKVDEKQKKVTIKHEELTSLDMPAMTMVFNVADDAMMEKVTVGKNVEFVADRVKGKITIVEMK